MPLFKNHIQYSGQLPSFLVVSCIFLVLKIVAPCGLIGHPLFVLDVDSLAMLLTIVRLSFLKTMMRKV